MFGFLKKKLLGSVEKVNEVVTKKVTEKVVEKKISEKDLKSVLWELQVSLLESDVALETSEKICQDLKNNLIGLQIRRGKTKDMIKKSFQDSISNILQQEGIDLLKKIKEKKGKPFVILFLGFNGSGKTTTIAKFANLLKGKKLKSLMAAADTYRAAAIQQLEKHGENLKVKVIKHDYGADAAAVVFDAIKHAKAKKIDVVLADTAGRSHTNANLMDELEKISRVNKPDFKILVIDSLTGNDAVEQARHFDNSIGVDGIVLTKMDVNEKGGAALSVAHTINKPILFIGTGQDYKDLEKFESKEMVKRILD